MRMAGTAVAGLFVMKKKSAPKQHTAERSPQPRSGHKAAHMWLGAELDSKRDEWVYHLEQDTIAEIEAAVAGWKAQS